MLYLVFLIFVWSGCDCLDDCTTEESAEWEKIQLDSVDDKKALGRRMATIGQVDDIYSHESPVTTNDDDEDDDDDESSFNVTPPSRFRSGLIISNEKSHSNDGYNVFFRRNDGMIIRRYILNNKVIDEVISRQDDDWYIGTGRDYYDHGSFKQTIDVEILEKQAADIGEEAVVEIEYDVFSDVSEEPHIGEVEMFSFDKD